MVDVLNQSEIDQLLQAIASGDSSVDQEASSSKPVKAYNFKRPNKFNKDQLRAVQMLHETFTRHLTSTLSTMTRCMVSAEVANVEQITYEEFVHSVVAPTTLAILDIEPFGGRALLEMNQHLIFALIDRMLGGRGDPLEAVRETTEIETVVVDRVILRLLDVLEESWATIHDDVRFVLNGRESNPFFVQIAPKTDMVLLVTVRVQVGNVDGRINLCIPFLHIEPIIDKFNPQQWFITKDKSLPEEEREKLRHRVYNVRVPLTAELGETSLSVSDISELAPGDVINMGKPLTEPGIIRVGPIPKFNVAFGTVGGKLSAQILEVLAVDEDMEGEELV